MRPDAATADENVTDSQQERARSVKGSVDSREIRDGYHGIDEFQDKKRISNRPNGKQQISDRPENNLPFALCHSSLFLNPAIVQFGNRSIPSGASRGRVVGNDILTLVQGLQDFL
jgi:hypothetical protein